MGDKESFFIFLIYLVCAAEGSPSAPHFPKKKVTILEQGRRRSCNCRWKQHQRQKEWS